MSLDKNLAIVPKSHIVHSDDETISAQTPTLRSYYNHPVEIQKLLPVHHIYAAYKRIKPHIVRTPLTKSLQLSQEFDANIYLKREGLQVVRSYKLRGALNKICQLSPQERIKTVFCASAGNHAQGVAYACALLKMKGVIYMPTVTPTIKFNAVKNWGKQYVQIELYGDTFDESYLGAKNRCDKEGGVFIHPFDDDQIIAGQGTIAMEILEDIPEEKIDFMFFPIGGGGCGAGITSYFRHVSPETVLIGVQPSGSPSMQQSIKHQQVVELSRINTFVDGAAVKKSGQRTFEILNSVLKDITLVPEGHVCTTMMRMFNEEGLLIEPAGALSIAALDQFRDQIKGKTVVCLISGSNNDLGRMAEIRILSEMHRGLQYYMFVNFYTKPGALKQFLVDCLGPNDELTHIEHTRKTNKEKGPALVGIKVKEPMAMKEIEQKMKKLKIGFEHIDPNSDLFKILM